MSAVLEPEIEVAPPPDDRAARGWPRIHAEIKADRARLMALCPEERDRLLPEFNAHVARLRNKEKVEAEHRAFLALSPRMRNAVFLAKAAERRAREQREADAAFQRGGIRGFAAYVWRSHGSMGSEICLIGHGDGYMLTNRLTVDKLADLYQQLHDGTHQPEHATVESADGRTAAGDPMHGMHPPIGGLLRGAP